MVTLMRSPHSFHFCFTCATFSVILKWVAVCLSVTLLLLNI